MIFNTTAHTFAIFEKEKSFLLFWYIFFSIDIKNPGSGDSCGDNDGGNSGTSDKLSMCIQELNLW